MLSIFSAALLWWVLSVEYGHHNIDYRFSHFVPTTYPFTHMLISQAHWSDQFHTLKSLPPVKPLAVHSTLLFEATTTGKTTGHHLNI